MFPNALSYMVIQINSDQIWIIHDQCFWLFLKLMWGYFHYRVISVCFDRRKKKITTETENMSWLQYCSCFISCFFHLAGMDNQTIFMFQFLCNLLSKNQIMLVLWLESSILCWKYIDQNPKLCILGTALYKLVWDLKEILIPSLSHTYFLPL